MYKWVVLYTAFLLLDLGLYDLLPQSIFLFQGVFLILVSTRTSLNSLLRLLVICLVSIIFGALFQQNLGLMALAVVLAIVVYQPLSVLQNKLDEDLVIGSLFFNFFALILVVLGNRPTILWWLAFFVVNISVVGVAKVLINRLKADEQEFV